MAHCGLLPPPRQPPSSTKPPPELELELDEELLELAPDPELDPLEVAPASPPPEDELPLLLHATTIVTPSAPLSATVNKRWIDMAVEQGRSASLPG
jgi:hypothetical protein